jgi:hypothetical protein
MSAGRCKGTSGDRHLTFGHWRRAQTLDHEYHCRGCPDIATEAVQAFLGPLANHPRIWQKLPLSLCFHRRNGFLFDARAG